MNENLGEEDSLALAARVREACINAALTGYEEAAIAGLCGEGALEVAISAMRRVDLSNLCSVHTPTRSVSE